MPVMTCPAPEPFLHFEKKAAYNPLTDKRLMASDPDFAVLKALSRGSGDIASLDVALRDRLLRDGWLIEPKGDPSGRYRLKYVALEATTHCNQACDFCPVSTAPRARDDMAMGIYEDIVRQLAKHRDTIEGVSMVQYNEPTVDPLFLDRLAVLRSHDLPVALNSNATGLTPKTVDRIEALGGLSYLSINLSTLDRAAYEAERRHDHLPIVQRNMDQLVDRRIAPKQDIAVLGHGDDLHEKNHAEISQRYGNGEFDVRSFRLMDRAGQVATGQRPPAPIRRLGGCEQIGSRPLQWVHITPKGECVLCCQDYDNRYVVGDLRQQSLDEVLTGPEMARMRRWAYGLEEAPEDFICRKCAYARARPGGCK